MHRDTVIGIVGVVILVAAMVGVFTYERGQAGNLPDAGSGSTTNFTAPAESGTVALGATEDVDISLNQTGMTNVTFTLTWTATNGVDTLRLVVTPANDTGLTSGFESDAEDDGEITLTVPVPNTNAAGTTGVGNWRVSVEFVSADPDLPAPDPVPPPPGTTDTEVDFTIDIAGTAYGTT